MRLGAHMSTAGGTFTAFKRAEEATCDSMLIFTKSNRQWKAKPLTDEDIQQYKEAATGIQPYSSGGGSCQLSHQHRLARRGIVGKILSGAQRRSGALWTVGYPAD